MSGFWGADSEALRSLGSACVRRAEMLADLESMLASGIESMEWTGEDAETFRAEWAGRVRPGLQDCFVELRQGARRLVSHAEEQEHASSPDGSGGTGGGSGGSGAFRRGPSNGTESSLPGLVGGETAPGLRDSPDGELAQLLREVLGTEDGRAAFLGSLLGTAFGGLLADMIGRALEGGLAPENLLTGLGAGTDLGALLGQLPPELAAAGDGRAAGEPTGASEAADGSGSTGADGEAAASEGATQDGGGSGGGASGGSGAGSDGGSASGGGADAADETGAGSEVTAGASLATGGPTGMLGTADAETLGEGFAPSERIEGSGDEGDPSLLDQLLAMLEEVFPAAGTGSVTSAAAIGQDIGRS